MPPLIFACPSGRPPRGRRALAGGGVEEGADGEDLAHLGQLLVDFGLLPGELVEFALDRGTAKNLSDLVGVDAATVTAEPWPV